MNGRFIVKLGIRNLLQRKLRSVLTMLAVGIGVSSTLFLLSLSSGLRQEVVSQILAATSSTTMVVSSSGEGVLTPADVHALAGLSNVTSVEEEVVTAGKVMNGSSAIDVVIHAVGGRYYELLRVSPTKGSLPASLGNQILVNTAAARALSLGEGTLAPIKFTAQTSGIEVKGDVRVSGIIDTYDTPHIFIPLKLLRDGGVLITSQAHLQLASDDVHAAASLRQKVTEAGFASEYVGDTIQDVERLFAIFQAILGLFGAVALAISVLGIFNTLTVNLLEKTREVGFMKSIGVQDRDVKRLFLAEAYILCLVGGFTGVLWAFFLAGISSFTLNHLASMAGYPHVTYFLFPPWLLLATFLLVGGLGYVIGYIPARRASLIDPLDALRYE